MLDILILLPLVYGLARGIMRGFFKEITAIFGLLISFVVAKAFEPMVCAELQKMVTWDSSLSQTVAFLVVFFTCEICISLISWLLTRLMHAIHLGWLNRLAGGLVGAFKWAFIVSVILNCVNFLDEHFHFMEPQVVEQSYTYRPIQKIAPVGLVAWDEAIKQ